MSLHRQLLLSALFILLLSSALGAVAIYLHAVSKIALEMDASLAVSQQTLQRSIGDFGREPDPGRRLSQIISAFDGDRHVSVALISPGGQVTARSAIRKPADPAPDWFFQLVSVPFREIRYSLPPQAAALGSILLQPYPENEVAEAWSDAVLTFEILAVFFVFVLVMIVWLQRRAFRPLMQLQHAFAQVGAGRYETRVPGIAYAELQPLLGQFNAMAEQLAQSERQKNLLRAQIQRIHEDEGAELARDLHDEVAPFLVAVSTDAALIRHSLSENAIDRIACYADGIATSVSHMQRHLRDILARLRSNSLAEMGLSNGVDMLVEFWQQRQADLDFEVDISVFDLPEALSHLAFRIVQEAVTNAVRHGKPKHVMIRIESVESTLRIEVMDDGKGFDARENHAGFGIIGMMERANAVGGTVEIGRRAGGGTLVSGALPLNRAGKREDTPG